MIQNAWLREVGENIRLQPLSGQVSQKVLNEIDSEVRKVIQLGFKLQKRAKRKIMTVEDVNLALTVLHTDKVYGLERTDRHRQIDEQNSSNISRDADATAFMVHNSKIDLANYASRPLPQYPLIPEVHFHWLAVGGVQPIIPQNPEVLVYDASADTTGLPREIAYFYTKLTQLVLSATSCDSSRQAVCDACSLLRHDCGLQPLVGYLSRFIFVQIRRHLKNIYVLQAILQVIESLVLNTYLNLENCLHQLLPSIFSCIVGSKIGDEITDSSAAYSNIHFPVGCHNVWTSLKSQHIRNFGAYVVHIVMVRYEDNFPDLLPRICKTYLQAAHCPSKKNSASAVRYGGIIGLGMLGEKIIEEVLIPNLNSILVTSKQLIRSDDHITVPSQETGIATRDYNNFFHSQEDLLFVSIINWYIKRNMSTKPCLDYLDQLKKKIDVGDTSDYVDQDGKRRKLLSDSLTNVSQMNMQCGWDEFSDNSLELFVPNYVASSKNLPQCSCLFI